MCKHTPGLASKYGSFPGHFPNIINVTSAVDGCCSLVAARAADRTCPVCNVLRIQRPSMRLESNPPSPAAIRRLSRASLRAPQDRFLRTCIASKSVVGLRSSPQECPTISRGCETNNTSRSISVFPRNPVQTRTNCRARGGN